MENQSIKFFRLVILMLITFIYQYYLFTNTTNEQKIIGILCSGALFMFIDTYFPRIIVPDYFQ